MSVQVVLVYNKANVFGIKRDAELLESMIMEYNRSIGITFAKVRHADLLEPPVACDVCIHLEIPCAVWMPFAHNNILMVNSEWWVDAWEPLLKRFNQVLIKVKGTDLSGAPHATFVPWACALSNVRQTGRQPKAAMDVSAGCLWLLGGSRNKREFAEKLIGLWKESYPPLFVYTTSPLDAVEQAKNVKITVKDLDTEERERLQAYFPVHLCASKSEGFGLAAAEGEAAGAFLILNNIDSYTSNFTSNEHIGWLNTPLTTNAKYTKARFADLSGNTSLGAELDEIMGRLSTLDIGTVRVEQMENAKKRTQEFKDAMTSVLRKAAKEVQDVKEAQRGNRHLPPALPHSECPPISVITLSYNRRKFIDLAFHNILLSDYPKDKIEWIVVDDSNVSEEQISDKIATFAKRAPCAQVVYVPLPRKHSVGYKRNVGVERASNDIILCMDDDDHYPETSFRRRVGWLTRPPGQWKPKAVGCATIACYDLVKGLSAVNTPPWELGQAERVSEATLTFYKSFWEAQKFPQVNASEGEGFLKGREDEFLEIPPQQIIVAFSHQGNSSGRRIPVPEKMKPGCFWDFPKDYLIWIHKLAGVEVEEEKNTVHNG